MDTDKINITLDIIGLFFLGYALSLTHLSNVSIWSSIILGVIGFIFVVIRVEEVEDD